MLKTLLLGKQGSLIQFNTMSAKWLSTISEELFAVDRAGMKNKVHQDLQNLII